MEEGKYLLDTHCLLWVSDEFERFSPKVLNIIRDSNNELFFSQTSLFEIAIKLKIGKLPEAKGKLSDLVELLLQNKFTHLPLDTSHLIAYDNTPLFAEHRDPFDRILVAQAFTEDIPIITIDPKFQLYTNLVSVIW